MRLVSFPHFVHCLQHHIIFSKAPTQRIAQCSSRYTADDWKQMVRFRSHPIITHVQPSIQLVTFGTKGTSLRRSSGIAVVLQGTVNHGGRGTTFDSTPLTAHDDMSAVVILHRRHANTDTTPLVLR